MHFSSPSTPFCLSCQPVPGTGPAQDFGLSVLLCLLFTVPGLMAGAFPPGGLSGGGLCRNGCQGWLPRWPWRESWGAPSLTLESYAVPLACDPVQPANVEALVDETAVALEFSPDGHYLGSISVRRKVLCPLSSILPELAGSSGVFQDFVTSAHLAQGL